MNNTGVIDRFLATFTSYIDSGFGLLGGEVELDTAPGRGTCVRLQLPRVAAHRPSGAG